AVREGELDGLAHHVRVAAVEAAGDVGRRDVGHDVLVAPQGPAAVALAHVAVDVDVDAHSFAMTSLAIRSTWAGWSRYGISIILFTPGLTWARSWSMH